jgi:hypothetical protein
MKLLKLILSSIIVSCLASCGGGGGSASTDTSAVADSSGSIPDSLPNGTSISFNPEITLQGELSLGSPSKATYRNTITSSLFPLSETETSVDITLSKTSDVLELSFTVSGKAIALKLGNFLDLGSTGHFDEFEVESFIDGESKGKSNGRFVGATKPRNKSVSSTLDTSGPPTEIEFKKYIVGKLLRHLEDDFVDDDGGYAVFNADGTVTDYELNGEKSDDDNTRYEYSYNNGDPRIEFTESYQRDGKTVTEYDTIKLVFNNFYEGTYEVVASDDTEDIGETGTFQIFGGIKFD